MDFTKITSYPYISGYTYRTFADHAICDPGDTTHMQKVCKGIDPRKVQTGDILYVSGVKAKEFFVKIAPAIEVPFFVVTAQWDPGPDHSFLPLLSENLIRWYTINAHLEHEKIVPIPLGLQNRHWRRDGNVQSEPDTYTFRNDVHKVRAVFASFSIANNPQERMECERRAHRAFDDNLHIRRFAPHDRENDVFVNVYFDTVAEHKFVLCPWGAGIDTHRLWESMYLGCIPITRRHPVYRDFEDYPIIMVDRWEQLDSLNLMDLWDDLSAKLKCERRIYPDHWERVLQNERSRYTDRPIQGISRSI